MTKAGLVKAHVSVRRWASTDTGRILRTDDRPSLTCTDVEVLSLKGLLGGHLVRTCGCTAGRLRCALKRPWPRARCVHRRTGCRVCRARNCNDRMVWAVLLRLFAAKPSVFSGGAMGESSAWPN